MKQVVFDPVRAHGAWIYIFLSVAAGSMLEAKHGVEPALLGGTSFVGAYLVIAAFVVGIAREQRQALVGIAQLLVAPPLALALGGDSSLLLVANGRPARSGSRGPLDAGRDIR